MGEFSCQDFAARIGDYVDGVLTPAETGAMNVHRLACAACGRFLADYEQIPALVRRATSTSMPAAAKARLRRLLAHGWRRRT